MIFGLLFKGDCGHTFQYSKLSFADTYESATEYMLDGDCGDKPFPFKVGNRTPSAINPTKKYHLFYIFSEVEL
jgi:hypothetical protein